MKYFIATVFLATIWLGQIEADDRVCKLWRFGKMTNFVGEEENIENPCAFMLTDMTCGRYRVQVR